MRNLQIWALLGVAACGSCHAKTPLGPEPAAPSALDLAPADSRGVAYLPKLGSTLDGLSELFGTIAQIPGAEVVGQWSSQLANAFGQDLRTASGRAALGLDSDREAAVWWLQGKPDPVLALPVQDADKLEAALKTRGELQTARHGSFVVVGHNAAEVALPASPASHRAELRTLFDRLGHADVLVFTPAAETPAPAIGPGILPSLGTAGLGLHWSRAGLSVTLHLIPTATLALALGTLGSVGAPSVEAVVASPVWLSLGGEPSAWGALFAAKLPPFEDEESWLALVKDLKPGLVVEAGLSSQPSSGLAGIHALGTVRDAAAAQKQLASFHPRGWHLAMKGETLEATSDGWGERARLASIPKSGPTIASARGDPYWPPAQVRGWSGAAADGLAGLTMRAIVNQIGAPLGHLGTIAADLRQGRDDWILDLNVPLR